MNSKKILPLSLLIGLIAAGQQIAFAQESTAEELLTLSQTLFQPLPDGAQLDEANPTTAGEIELGKQLYFDPRLSLTGNISCNTCHNLSTYGVDNSSKSFGVDAQLGGRNSPTVLNAALNTTQFWDGRAQDVEEQAGGPILNPVEMALPDEAAAVERINAIPGYREEFSAVYGQEDAVTFANITKAIAAFERTLLTPSPFDAFLEGDTAALNTQELRGLEAFVNNGCISCHQGVNLGGDQFQKFGLVSGPYWAFTGSEAQDTGRYEVTQAESDKFLFRVPTLRNIEHTYPYFHDGSVNSLENAVRIMGMAQLGRELSEEDVSDMVAFLNTLSGTIDQEALVLPVLPKSVFDEEIVNMATKEHYESSQN